MGDAELGAIEIDNNSFHTTTALEMDGHAVEAEVSGRFDGEHAEGFLKLQNSPGCRSPAKNNRTQRRKDCKRHISLQSLDCVILPKIKRPAWPTCRRIQGGTECYGHRYRCDDPLTSLFDVCNTVRCSCSYSLAPDCRHQLPIRSFC